MSDQEQWRDARFKKALDSAPDLAERPSDAVRETILSKARATAAEAAGVKAPPSVKRNPWWSLGLPWNSALGTVAVICFVSVLWWREELPKQAEETAAPTPQQQAVQKVEAAVSAPPVQAATESEKKTQPSRSARDAAAAAAAADAVKRIRPPVVEKIPPYIPAPEVTIVPAPAPAPAPVLAMPAPPPVAMPMPAAAPALAPVPVAAKPAPVAEPKLDHITVTGARVAAVVPWTALRVRTASGPVVVPNDQLSDQGQILLQQQLRDQRRAGDQVLARSASGPIAVTTSHPPGLIVEVLDGDQVVGRLELAEGQLREAIEKALSEH